MLNKIIKCINIYLIVILILSYGFGITWAADSKISALTNETSPTSDDYIVIVDDPAGTAATKRATLLNLWNNLFDATGTLTNLGTVNITLNSDCTSADEGTYLWCIDAEDTSLWHWTGAAWVKLVDTTAIGTDVQAYSASLDNLTNVSIASASDCTGVDEESYLWCIDSDDATLWFYDGSNWKQKFSGTICTVATIPAAPTSGDLIIITDGDEACDITTGSGSIVSLHRYDGSNWICVGDGASVDLSGYQTILTEISQANAEDPTYTNIEGWTSRRDHQATAEYLEDNFGYGTQLAAEPTGEWPLQLACFQGYTAGGANGDPADLHSATPSYDGAYCAICGAAGTPGDWYGFIGLDSGVPYLIMESLSADVNYSFDSTPGTDDTWQGSVMTVTAGETLAQWNIVYLKYNTDGPRAYAYNAATGDSDNDTYRPVGIATAAAASAGDSVVIGIGFGIASNEGWTFTNESDEGKPIFAGETDGAITLTRPSDSGDHIVHLGNLIDEDEVMFSFGNITDTEVQ